VERHQGAKHSGSAGGLFLLIVTVLFAFIYWVLMPAFPLGVTYTKGLLGIDQRTTVRSRSNGDT
jgi:cytochrome c oxidase cbb3-type subunit 3